MRTNQYHDFLRWLQMEDDRFFQRLYTFRPPGWLDRFEHDTRMTIKRMRGCKSLELCEANPTWDCGWRCSYKTLCDAYHDGADWQAIANGLYQQGEPR